jgi:sulfate permease, SulP family
MSLDNPPSNRMTRFIPGLALLKGFSPALLRTEVVVAVTAFGVLCIGVLAGILFAVVLSLISILYRIARPHDALLDDVDAAGGTVYRGVHDKATALTEPGLIVYRFDAPLVFANAAFFTERLEGLIVNAGPGLTCIILDAEPISDFDSTAAEALESLDADLERAGVDLWIARANGPLRQLLEVTGLTKRLGPEHIYPSVRAAVVAYRAQLSVAS